MTPKYFAYIDGEQQGPFDVQELINIGLRPSTYVWCKGMDDWHRADEVDEIRSLFKRHLEEKRDTQVEEPVKQPNLQQSPFGPNPQNPPEEEPQEKPIRFGRIPASVEPEPDYDLPPQVSMTLAVISLVLCFPPTGIAAVIYAYKTQKYWQQALAEQDRETSLELKKRAHDCARQAKMWLGITVCLGIIFFTLIFSIRPS